MLSNFIPPIALLRRLSPNYSNRRDQMVDPTNGRGHGAKADGPIPFKVDHPQAPGHYGTPPVTEPPMGKREAHYLETWEYPYQMIAHETLHVPNWAIDALMFEFYAHVIASRDILP